MAQSRAGNGGLTGGARMATRSPAAQARDIRRGLPFRARGMGFAPMSTQLNVIMEWLATHDTRHFRRGLAYAGPTRVRARPARFGQDRLSSAYRCSGR